jgi:predicted dehydrogenase
MTPLRIGLLGCSDIARLAVVRPARLSDAVEVRAVASRSSAQEFAQAHGIPRVCRSYDELVGGRDIDAVYVGLPNRLHARWTAAALDAGKHVLVEKPLCLTAAEADVLAQRGRSARRGVLEAVTTQAHPWLADARALVQSGALGPLRQLIVRLAFDLDSERREAEAPRPAGGGAFLDTAPYWLQLAQSTCGLSAATARSLTVRDGPGGADVAATAVIALADGAEAVLEASHADRYTAAARFAFDHGELRVPNLFRANVARCRLPVERVDHRNAAQTTDGYGPFNAFETQLDAFLAMVADPEPWTWIEPAAERVRMAESLTRLAREGPTWQAVPTDSDA